MGWIIAGAVILVLVVILMIPVYVGIEYKGELTVRISYLFVKIKVFPLKDKSKGKDKKKKKKSAEKEDKEKGKKKKQSIIDVLKIITDIIRSIEGKLKKVIIISDIKVFMEVVGDDACDTALSYGKASAGINTALAVLKNLIIVKRSRVSVFPNFTGEENKTYVLVKFRVIPAAAAIAVIRIIVSYMKINMEQNQTTSLLSQGSNKKTGGK